MTDEPRELLTVDMPNLTVIQDAGSQEALLHIRGALVLPVGARIELGSHDQAQHGAPVDGVVTAVRLWGASGNPTVVLEVLQVPPGDLTDMP